MAEKSRSHTRSSTSTVRRWSSERDTVIAYIDFFCDLENRTGHVRVPGHLELRLEPIKNPVTGKPHWAVIRLPEGFEYREAEMASGSFQGHKDWDFEHSNCYGAMWYAAYGPYGILEA